MDIMLVSVLSVVVILGIAVAKIIEKGNGVLMFAVLYSGVIAYIALHFISKFW